MKEALLYKKLDHRRVNCQLCSHYCIILPEKRGRCGVRENKDGQLFSLVYGKLIAQNIDPIEKKPFFHFLAGTVSYSIAAVGCNFRCLNCQNYDISQAPVEKNFTYGFQTGPEEVVQKALENNCQSISYTYTEPTVFFEFAYDVARIAREKGLKNLFVTNGYMSPEMLEIFHPYLDGANVDLKGATDEFYQKVCGARLEPVKKNLKIMKRYGIWIEVTTLIIPDLNDTEEDFKKIAAFIARELGTEVPWHLSGFHPTYKLSDSNPTPLDTLMKAYNIGKQMGLKYIYIGNFPGTTGEHTACPQCGKTIIKRYGFEVLENKIKGGCCGFCQEKIAGVWK
jgi:pyruvate formate lyase activating enzyme